MATKTRKPETQTDDLETARAKIQKLLALAYNNTNEAEAMSALLKAQEFMAKYNISVDEANTTKIEYMEQLATHRYDLGYRIPLAHLIGDNFRCRIFLRNGTIVFFGHLDDARLAKEAFEFAYEFALHEGNKHYNDAYNNGRVSKGVFNSYTYGFIDELKQKFAEQCVALMIVTPHDVNEKFEEMSAKMGHHRSRANISRLHRGAYEAGQRDGKP